MATADWPQHASAQTWWAVSVNNGQYKYVLEAMTAADAGVEAQRRWGVEATQRQLTRGVYALHIRAAKFGEIRQQPVLAVSVQH